MKKGKVKFFKRINVQIITSILILSIIYLVSSFFSSYAQEQALGGMTRIYDKWIQIDRIESQLQNNVSDNQVSLEMMGYSHELERIQELQESIYANIDSDAELLEELNALAADLEDKDIVGTDRETVETIISNQNAAVIKLDKLLKETIELHASGDAEAAQVKYEEMKAVSVEVQDYQNEFLTLIEEVIDSFVKERTEVANSYSKVSDVLFFVFIAVDVVVIFVVNRNVMKPIKVSSAKLNKIVDDIKLEQGNLNERLEIKRDNEVGHMVDGINMFIEQLQQIMVKIKEESVNMNQIASSINEKITESNEDITTFSATMEELSASMEEVSATLEQLATNGQYILNESNGMYTKAAQGKDFVLDVKNKAVDIRNEATESKNQTLELISSIRENLATAIEKSASVRKIDELTNEILSISSQTNLLALNASIEAARAGEQGKGFAVVADQIRELAENSKTTATNIQVISKMVIDSVDALSSNANDMITFIDGTVLVDYDKFVDTANAYYNDSDYMGNILQDFYESSNKLVDTMQIISDSLDGINIAVEESAEGVTSAASNTTNLVESMTHIMEEVNTNERIAKELSLEVKKFNEV